MEPSNEESNNQESNNQESNNQDFSVENEATQKPYTRSVRSIAKKLRRKESTDSFYSQTTAACKSDAPPVPKIPTRFLSSATDSNDSRLAIPLANISDSLFTQSSDLEAFEGPHNYPYAIRPRHSLQSPWLEREHMVAAFVTSAEELHKDGSWEEEILEYYLEAGSELSESYSALESEWSSSYRAQFRMYHAGTAKTQETSHSTLGAYSGIAESYGETRDSTIEAVQLTAPPEHMTVPKSYIESPFQKPLSYQHGRGFIWPEHTMIEFEERSSEAASQTKVDYFERILCLVQKDYKNAFRPAGAPPFRVTADGAVRSDRAKPLFCGFGRVAKTLLRKPSSVKTNTTIASRSEGEPEAFKIPPGKTKIVGDPSRGTMIEDFIRCDSSCSCIAVPDLETDVDYRATQPDLESKCSEVGAFQGAAETTSHCYRQRAHQMNDASGSNWAVSERVQRPVEQFHCVNTVCDSKKYFHGASKHVVDPFVEDTRTHPSIRTGHQTSWLVSSGTSESRANFASSSEPSSDHPDEDGGGSCRGHHYPQYMIDEPDRLNRRLERILHNRRADGVNYDDRESLLIDTFIRENHTSIRITHQTNTNTIESHYGRDERRFPQNPQLDNDVSTGRAGKGEKQVWTWI